MKSMTGFGSGRRESAIGALAVELRSVNHRFLDIALRGGGDLTAALEPSARTVLQKRFTRGRITISINFEPVPGMAELYSVNRPLLELLERECQDRGEKPRASRLLAIPGVIVVRSDEKRQEELRALFEGALEAACDDLERDRVREGAALLVALREFSFRMSEALAIVEHASPLVVAKFRDRLRQRIEELMGPEKASLDSGRLEQEVMFFADKADIGEETLRLGTHLKRLDDLLGREKEATGRPLDFLSQEILREVNTIGSKCRDLDIAAQVLEMKNLVESMKEQLANVE